MLAHNVSVFSKAVIFDMKQTVFDAPVSPHQRQRSERREIGQAAHSVLDAFRHAPVLEALDSLCDLDSAQGLCKV